MNPLYQEQLEKITGVLTFLPDKPEETPDSTLRALWHLAAGRALSAEAAMKGELPALDETARARLIALLDKRCAGVPLAHLTGRQNFVGMEMLAGPGALVPRRETELLARAAIELTRAVVANNGHARVVDVCTGSGNVALSVAHHVPEAHVFGADLSEEAVALAKLNSAHLGLEKRAGFRAGDLLAPFDTPEFHGSVDVLTCNPPYISSAKVEHMNSEISKYEPRLAFDGGAFGVNILMRLLQEAPRFIKPGGWLAFEVGLGQGPAMAKRLEKAGHFSDLRLQHDEHGAPRALAARYR
ncbi:MAG TPA: peptide chain release factor N(5)-glutamine methyltransferase [Steroidobacteraceae bacterium]|nr:peptide chain release factor N(5)-glutamine methyltransferase [Steroidobacteraceae bacterium]